MTLLLSYQPSSLIENKGFSLTGFGKISGRIYDKKRYDGVAAAPADAGMIMLRPAVSAAEINRMAARGTRKQPAGRIPEISERIPKAVFLQVC